jgi:dihydrofolate reductase
VTLSLILATDEAGAIGLRGGLPWDHPEDRAHFERETGGHAVIMGRLTWEEVGRPLDGRVNVVVSSSFVPPEGVSVAPTLEAAVALAREHDASPFVIGGARLFRDATALADQVWLTEIPGRHEADAFFVLDEGLSTRDAFIARGFVVAEERAGEGGLCFVRLVRDRSG